ncbi:arrestin domain-containing protein 3-like [Diadema antillarum]|uniref:arrestin domain-containing protein 3-like n=1 Tax=Diadema antillarum TaxID=105358 RepID=UPI003A8673B2
MGKLQAFEVVLDDNKDAYMPGDTIRGQVRIHLSAPKGYIAGLKVECKGKARTYWTKETEENDVKKVKVYKKKFILFKVQSTLWGITGANVFSATRLELAAGNHTFPFQLTLPSLHTPPPIESKYGWVRYYLTAVIERPWKFSHKTRRYLCIWSIKNMNSIPSVFVPLSTIAQKRVCCLFCESGLFSMCVTIDKRGYCPGESILITIELSNRTSRDVSSLSAVLTQHAEYNATNTREAVMTIDTVIKKIKFEGYNAHATVTFDRTPMLITPVPANDFDACGNINVEYNLKVKARLSGSPSSAIVKHPITIGTVPALPDQPGPTFPPTVPTVLSSAHQAYPPAHPGVSQAGYQPQAVGPQQVYPPPSNVAPSHGYLPPEVTVQGGFALSQAAGPAGNSPSQVRAQVHGYLPPEVTVQGGFAPSQAAGMAGNLPSQVRAQVHFDPQMGLLTQMQPGFQPPPQMGPQTQVQPQQGYFTPQQCKDEPNIPPPDYVSVMQGDKGTNIGAASLPSQPQVAGVTCSDQRLQQWPTPHFRPAASGEETIVGKAYYFGTMRYAPKYPYYSIGTGSQEQAPVTAQSQLQQQQPFASNPFQQPPVMPTAPAEEIRMLEGLPTETATFL